MLRAANINNGCGSNFSVITEEPTSLMADFMDNVLKSVDEMPVEKARCDSTTFSEDSLVSKDIKVPSPVHSVLKHRDSKESLESDGSPTKSTKKSNRHVSFSANPSIYQIENLSEYNSYQSPYDRTLALEVRDDKPAEPPCFVDDLSPKIAQPIIKSKAVITYMPFATTLEPIITDNQKLSERVPSVHARTNIKDNSEILIRNKLLYNDLPKTSPQYEPRSDTFCESDSRIDNIKQRLHRRLPKTADDTLSNSSRRGSTDSTQTSSSLGDDGEELDGIVPPRPQNIPADVPYRRSPAKIIPPVNVTASRGAIAALARGSKPKVVKVVPISSRIRIAAPMVKPQNATPVSPPCESISLPLSGFNKVKSSQSSPESSLQNEPSSLPFVDCKSPSMTVSNESFCEQSVANKIPTKFIRTASLETNSVSTDSSPSMDSLDTLLAKVNVTYEDLDNITIGPSPSCQTINTMSNDVSMESIQVSSSEDDLKNAVNNDMNSVITANIEPHQEFDNLPSTCEYSETDEIVVAEPNGNVFSSISSLCHDRVQESCGDIDSDGNCRNAAIVTTSLKHYEDSDSSTSDCFVEVLSPGDMPEMRNKKVDESNASAEDSEMKRLSANLSDVGYSTDQSNTLDSNELNDDLVAVYNEPMNLSRRNSDDSFCSALSPSDPIYVKDNLNTEGENFSNGSASQKLCSEGEDSITSLAENTVLQSLDVDANKKLSLCNEEDKVVNINDDTDENSCSITDSVSHSARDITLGPYPSEKCISYDDAQVMYEPSSLESDAAFGSLDNDSLASGDVFSDSFELNHVENGSKDGETIAISPLTKVSNIVSLFNKNSDSSSETQPKLPRPRSSIPCFVRRTALSETRSSSVDTDEPGNTDSLLRYKKQKVFSNRKALFEQLEKANSAARTKKLDTTSNKITRSVSHNQSPKQIRNSKIQRSIKDELSEIEGIHKVDPTKSPVIRSRYRKRSLHDDKGPLRDAGENQKKVPNSVVEPNFSQLTPCTNLDTESSVVDVQSDKDLDTKTAQEQFYRSSMEIKFQDLNFHNIPTSKVETSQRKIPQLHKTSNEISYIVEAKDPTMKVKTDELLIVESESETDNSANECPLNDLLDNLEKQQQDLENLSLKAELKNRDGGRTKPRKLPKVKKLISRFEKP